MILKYEIPIVNHCLLVCIYIYIYYIATRL